MIDSLGLFRYAAVCCVLFSSFFKARTHFVRQSGGEFRGHFMQPTGMVKGPGQKFDKYLAYVISDCALSLCFRWQCFENEGILRGGWGGWRVGVGVWGVNWV